MRERTRLPYELIMKLPNLRLITTCGHRNPSINGDACRERGIPVPAAAGEAHGPVDSTTEHGVAMILAAARNLAQNDASIKSGAWQASAVVGISGKTIGMVGLGRLGGNVAAIMSSAFGCRIIAWSSNLTQDAADEQAKALGLSVTRADGDKTFKAVSKEELFSAADVVSVHYVLSDRSRGIVSATDLARMKPSSFLVNTSRGPLVVEKDLLDTLKAGKIRGAALDVFDIEPLPADSEWRNKDWGTGGKSQLLVTPHIAYVEEVTMNAWYKQQVEDILRWKAGEKLERLIY